MSRQWSGTLPSFFRFSTDILCYRQPWREALMASPAAHCPPPVISLKCLPFPPISSPNIFYSHVLFGIIAVIFFLVQMWGDILSSLNFWHSLTVDFCIPIVKMFAFLNITSSGFPCSSAGGRFAWMQLEFKRLIVSSMCHMKIRQPKTILVNLSA